MKRILISGYLGFENFGDEALLHVLIENLTEVGYKRKDITVISQNPSQTAIFHNVNSISRWNLIDFVNSLLNHNTLIFIGGLFQDTTSLSSLVYYVLQLIFAGIFQKEIAFFAVGIGPLKRKISQTLFNFGLKSVHLVTVRDQTSAYLTPNKQNTVVTCDPVWSIKPDFSFQNKIPKVNWQLPILAVSMRNDKNIKNYHINNIVDKLSKAIAGMKDWQVVLIPCMPNEDLPILYELRDLLIRKSSAPNRVIMIENFSNFPITQQAGILASCDVMVGMRYHSLLVPLANGKPVFGLIYDQKVKSLLEFASQVGVSFRDDFDQPWNYFWQNLEHSSSMAKAAGQKASQLHKINIELLQAL
ncbi:MAG: polysaccharide pyruvyl transferase family protein [Candidatus Melainabacteria bacterium]|nr:polysaccharide pyruvyl transferase family protein [Candidatus Melainabacteria bacterium]